MHRQTLTMGFVQAYRWEIAINSDNSAITAPLIPEIKASLVYDKQKKETKNEILTVDDIFNYADILEKNVTNYDGEKISSSKSQLN
jgi:hypothetical protein